MLTDEQRHIWNEQMALFAYDVHVMTGTVEGPRRSDQLFLAVARHMDEVEAERDALREQLQNLLDTESVLVDEAAEYARLAEVAKKSRDKWQARAIALRAECERWKGTAREASQSVIWYSERVEWLLSATDIDPHQEGEAIMQALHDRLAERDALRERVARLEAIETAARALYQAQVEGGWPNDQDAEHDALGVALGEQEVSASDATE